MNEFSISVYNMDHFLRRKHLLKKWKLKKYPYKRILKYRPYKTQCASIQEMERWVPMVVVKIHIEIILFKLDVGGDSCKNIMPVTRHS